MNKNNSIKAIDKTNLTEQTKFRLSEIIGIENYFYEEINQRKLYTKKLKKYVFFFLLHRQNFNCFKCNKWLSINYFIYRCCRSTSWNCNCKFYFIFFYNNRNNLKNTEYNKKQKEKT